MKKIKVLNLYAGIGGNRKLWPIDSVTAIEIDKKIALEYSEKFPNDEVVVTDAHQYLLEHYDEYDFIWSSPPCQTHSNVNNYLNAQGVRRYPDMKLYEEIVLLSHFCKSKWVIENVKSYYNPLIKPFESGNHYFWSNFIISNIDKIERGIRTEDIKTKEMKRGFDLSSFNIPNSTKETLLNNVVFPELGLHIFNCAFKEIQQTIKRGSLVS